MIFPTGQHPGQDVVLATPSATLRPTQGQSLNQHTMGDTALACFGRIPWIDRQGVQQAQRRQIGNVNDDGDNGDSNGSDTDDKDGGDYGNNEEGDVDGDCGDNNDYNNESASSSVLYVRTLYDGPSQYIAN